MLASALKYLAGALLSTCTVVGSLITTTALGSQYNARVWQTEDGLPHNSIQCVQQSADGYLWVGTPEGLCRFDGIRFTVLNETLAPELKGRWFSAIHQSRDGALWIGTDGRGVYRVTTNGIFHYSRTNGLGGDSVRTIFEARNDAIWFGTGGGLSCFENGHFRTISKTNGLAHDVVRSICEDRDGSLWVATGDGLNHLQNEAVVATYRNETKNEVSLAHNSIRSLLVDRNGVLWVGSNGGLSRFDNGVFRNFSQQDGLLDATVSALYEDREGNLWIGTLGGLLQLVDGKPVPLQPDAGGIYDAVYAITEDSEGDIWIGTNAGLHRLKKRRFAALTKADGLSHNTTVSVLADGLKRTWVGTWGGALNEIHNGKIDVHSASQGLPFFFVLGLATTRSGHLWLGTDYDEGLYRFDLTGDGVTRWGKEHGFKDAAISVMCEDHEGSLWIGTRTALLRWKNEKFTRFTTSDGLPSNIIRSICEDRNHDVWIGTTTGLAKFRNEKVESVVMPCGEVSVLALLPDADGSLWIGTKGAGLVHRKAGTFVSYTTKEGLFSDDVFEIIESDGFLWMTCAKGIFRVNKNEFKTFASAAGETLQCIAYDKSDGLISVDCKGVAKPSVCKTADGQLWFATGKGIAITDGNLTVNKQAPPIFIERIVANKKTAFESGFSFHRSNHSLEVPPGGGDLEIAYTGLSLQAPEKNRFKYKLIGADNDWVDAGTRRAAYYNHLAPGSYTFQVIACNNDGVWNRHGAELVFKLQPHVWQTAFFKVTVIVLIAALLAGMYRLRMQRLRDIEKLRVRIAADLHDEVGSSLWSISLLSRMLHKSPALSEEDKTDASEINRIAQQTANSIRDIVWFINPDYDTMQDLILRMRDVANTTLNGVEHRFETTNLNSSRQLSLDFRQNVFLMYKEILTNIAKHSQARCIVTKVMEENDRWKLTVHDDGVGFDPNRESNGSGLKNLRRRAEKLSASLTIQSQTDNGSEIELSAPLR